MKIVSIIAAVVVIACVVIAIYWIVKEMNSLLNEK